MARKVANETIVLLGIKSIFTAQTNEHDNQILDQNTEQKFKAVAIRRLIRKLDRRLLPFLILLQIISLIDRATIGMNLFIQWLFFIHQIFVGHIRVMGIHKDLQMSPLDENWFMSIFFLASVRINSVYQC